MATTTAKNITCFAVDDCDSALSDHLYDRHLLDMEKNFDRCNTFFWFKEHWAKFASCTVIYLIAIFLGKRYMRDRPPYQLRGALLAWNAALSVINIFGAWRTISAILYQISLVGFYETLCGNHSEQYQQSLAIHFLWFGYLKILEFGDTGFIILRKNPLMFLHYFHHGALAVITWSAATYSSPLQAYFMAINYFEHAILYPYFFLKGFGVHLPKPIGMAITLLQILQMPFAVYITMYTYYMRATPGVGCCVVDGANRITIAFCFILFLLFSNYFIWAYIRGKPTSAKSAKKAIELAKKKM